MSLADASDRLVISSYALGVEVGFEERVRVAADAGFAGIGLRAENYWAARAAGLEDGAMQDILERHGIAVMEVEYITEWGSATTRDAKQRAKEQTIFHMARTFGVRHMNTGLLDTWPLDDVIEGFAGVCERAGDDLVVALEFLPWGGVPDLRTAWQVISAAGQDNAGLVIDTWHWCRGGVQREDLVPVPVERIVEVQLCDVQEVPIEPAPSRYEGLHHRLLPGHGYGDVEGTLRLLEDKGVDGVVAAEVISDELIASGLDNAAAAIFAASRDILGRLGGAAAMTGSASGGA